MQFDQLKRREFITLLGGVAGWPLAARAQQAAMPVIGFLHAGSPGAGVVANAVAVFRQALAENGYVEGQSVTIEYRYAEGQYDKLSELAADLVRRQVSVIVATPNLNSARVAQAATAMIPILFMVADDPAKLGLVASLNRPGGNATGVTMAGSELGPKRLELLHEVVPAVKKIAILVNQNNRVTSEADIRGARAAALPLGLEVIVVNGGAENEIETAFATAVQQGAGAVYIGDDAVLNGRREQVAALALRHKLPTMSGAREAVRAGQLIGYGADDVHMYRQAGVYVGRILKGEKPADLPVVQPTKFDLVINLKAANALGLTIPPGVLAIADEVIE